MHLRVYHCITDAQVPSVWKEKRAIHRVPANVIQFSLKSRINYNSLLFYVEFLLLAAETKKRIPFIGVSSLFRWSEKFFKDIKYDLWMSEHIQVAFIGIESSLV